MNFLKPFRIHPSHDATDKPYIRGIPSEVKPVRGIDPKAQSKVILREGEYARVLMMTDTQDSEHLLEDRGEYWLVAKEVKREVLIK